MLGLLGSDFKHHQGPFLPGQYSTPYADCYRCPLKLRYPDCGIACAEYVRDVIRYQTGGRDRGDHRGADPGHRGQRHPARRLPARDPVGWPAITGALLFADEMITGFGRTGSMWGTDHEGVVPDIMTVGKGVGGGFPLAGVVSTDELTAAKPWSNPSFSSSSYGGNPLASAAGLAALEIILNEDLVKNADRVGAIMLTELERAQGEVPHRRRGARPRPPARDRAGRGPAEPTSRSGRTSPGDLYQECLRRGLVAMTYSPTIRINPPLVITEDLAREGLAILDEALGVVLQRHGRD